MRLEKNGPNALTPPPKKSPVLVFLRLLLAPFNVMLIVSGVLSFILYAIDSSSTVNLFLGIILIAVTFMNASIEFYQQYKTEAILDSFKKLAPTKARVLRDEGKMQEVPAETLVQGDVVVLKSGDKVPADIRIIHVVDCKVDNSSITGESEPQERNPQPASGGNPLEAPCLLLSGTMIVSGDAIGIVIRVGDHSLLGQIAGLTVRERKNDRSSQLGQEIQLFVKRIAAVAILTAVVFFIFGLVRGFGISITFSFAIGTFVAFVPQGLPATVTTMLSIAAKRLAKKQVLVKDLHAVETLGSITLLASDKTGTLTQNRMTVVGAWLNGQVYSAIPSEREPVLDGAVPNMDKFLACCSLCSRCKIEFPQPDQPDAAADGTKVTAESPSVSEAEPRIFGDATEQGLVRFAMQRVNVMSLNESCPKVHEIPFNSTNKWHLTIHRQQHANGKYVMYLKGAPEKVLALCSGLLSPDGSSEPMNEGIQQRFNQAYDYFAGQGKRVLGLAMLPLDVQDDDYEFQRDPPNYPLSGFCFIGMVALIDPPKKGVRKAIAACRTAGIQVVMVTGDHPRTAEAIARQIGLIQGETQTEVAMRTGRAQGQVQHSEFDVVVVHGETLEVLDDRGWDEILQHREIVFARTTPKHKLEIVTRFQTKGHIVGVSGDGVNDSPALKKADLGISMNVTGSDVSKDAAAMILLDDNFASIVSGIAEGRLIFVNLKKSIRYTLTHIMPEVLAFLVFIICQIPLPIASLLVLIIDLGNELGPAIAYAYELPEDDLMLVGPRKVMVKPAVIAAIASSENLPDMSERTEENIAIISIEEEATDVTPQVAPWYRRAWLWVKEIFVRQDTGDVLVDSDTLIWCYLEAGLIETAGAFGAYLIVLAWDEIIIGDLWGSAQTYFQDGAPPLLLANGTFLDADGQVQVNREAAGAYYAAIVICQWFNHFICKHLYSYPWGKDLFR